MRTIVNLSKKQIAALDAYAKSKGISRATVIRKAVATCAPIEKKRKKRDLNYWLNHPAIGSEKRSKGFDSVEYQRKLRAEWDHRAKLYNY